MSTQPTDASNAAPFTLTLHRGEGMVLLAMNWRDGPPPRDFVGFAISYREPRGDRDYVVPNRIGFTPAADDDHRLVPSTVAPIQKFRWIHFPLHAELPGPFRYRVTPVFMNTRDELSYGTPLSANVELRRETFPGQVNVAFTRGFVASQAFVERYASSGPIDTLLPTRADDGLTFTPTHPKTDEALQWMGFEAREAVLSVLDEAITDTKAQVRVVAYDLNEPQILRRLEQLGNRLRVIIDNSDSHGEKASAESQAEARLRKSAGPGNVQRQHVGKLQHNKTITVDSPTTQKTVFGSTNFTWRGLYVQNNNAIVVTGEKTVQLATQAFDTYWEHPDDVAAFAASPPARLTSLGLADVDASIAFSPHVKNTALLSTVATDIRDNTTSSLLYSLAFLYQTKGQVRNAIAHVAANDDLFVYGLSDRGVKGLTLQRPGGNPAPVFPDALTADDVPAAFQPEPKGGNGIRLHHKFVVIDFDKPTARVYTGSYNFSTPADNQNGENLLLIRDQRIATAYAVEAMRLFDHYRFRIARRESHQHGDPLLLAKPPRTPGDTPWWDKDYTDPRKIRDRLLFAHPKS